MTSARFLRVARTSGLVDDRLSLTVAAVVFAEARVPKTNRVAYDRLSPRRRHRRDPRRSIPHRRGGGGGADEKTEPNVGRGWRGDERRTRESTARRIRRSDESAARRVLRSDESAALEEAMERVRVRVGRVGRRRTGSSSRRDERRGSCQSQGMSPPRRRRRSVRVRRASRRYAAEGVGTEGVTEGVGGDEPRGRGRNSRLVPLLLVSLLLRTPRRR